MTASDRVDRDMLDQLRELLGERFAELVERFTEDGERRIECLRSAVASCEFDTVHAEAHGLKGSSRNIGANFLAELCAELEDDGRNGNSANFATLFAALEQEFAAVCATLREYPGR